MSGRLRSGVRFAGPILAVLIGASVYGQQGTGSPVAPVRAFDVVGLSIAQLQQAMADGRVTSRGLVEAYIARIEAYDAAGASLNAIAMVNPEARVAADALDADRAAGRIRGPLHGIPVLVKDNYETIEMPTAAGSIALAGSHPKRDAVLVQRLKAAGAVILGKTNMHELAAGITTVGTTFGQTRNPYDPTRNPGGSSGGTGAAIGAEFAAAGLGSDTCGSIRIPSAHNNLVGLRGTQGSSSRTGIVPLSSTQDIGGPLARSIADLAILLDVTVGPDPADASTVTHGRRLASFREAVGRGTLKGAKFGLVRSLFGSAPEDAEVTAVLDKALAALKAAGAMVEDVAVPGLDELLRGSSMLNADFKADLADYLSTIDNPPVHSLGEILEAGLIHSSLEAGMRTRNAVPSRDTEPARRARVKRAALASVIDAVIDEQQLTALVYPTLRRKAARIGEAQAGSNCQVSASSGLPALSVPAGFTDDGLPVGLELMGRAFGDVELVQVGAAIEATLATRQLPFSTPRLVDGHAPAPLRARVVFDADQAGTGGALAVDLIYDAATSTLGYEMSSAFTTSNNVRAVWIHAGSSAAPGAARHRLFAPRMPLRGSVALTTADRRALAETQLLVRLYADGEPAWRDVSLQFDGE